MTNGRNISVNSSIKKLLNLTKNSTAILNKIVIIESVNGFNIIFLF